MSLKLQTEGGVTQISLENGIVLHSEHGPPRVVVIFRRDSSEVEVEVEYQGGTKHVFTGFGISYYGEGPHGFATWAADNGVPLTLSQIAAFPTDTMGEIWAWYAPDEADLEAEFDPLWDDSDLYDDSMDGDHQSALASAGLGTDEDYGDFGGDDEW